MLLGLWAAPGVVLFRVHVRPRSMFWGLRRFNFASLKPSMPESLGGRRGSRSDMNNMTIHDQLIRSTNFYHDLLQDEHFHLFN